jgi:hypothetical protein
LLTSNHLCLKWSGIVIHYVFPEDAETAQRLDAKMHGDTKPFRFKLRRGDDSAVWVDVRGTPMPMRPGYSKELPESSVFLLNSRVRSLQGTH